MARGASPTEKTAPKTVGQPFAKGSDPRRGHGKPGRSGRKPKAFLERCLAATEDDELWQSAKKKQPMSLLDLSASYTHAKPKQDIEHSGEVTFRVIFDD
jgi:hypothetical protein